MDKKITDLTMEELCKLAWDGMDEEQRNLITSVLDIKKECLVLLEDQFTQQFHDVGDELYDLVERCEGDPYTGVSGGTETAKLIIEICEGYLGRNPDGRISFPQTPPRTSSEGHTDATPCWDDLSPQKSCDSSPPSLF